MSWARPCRRFASSGVVVAVVLVGAAAASGCSSSASPSTSPSSSPGGNRVGATSTTLPLPVAPEPVAADSLRSRAAARGLHLGAAVLMPPFDTEPDYQRVLGQQFNMVVPENAAKFRFIHPGHNQYDFGPMDRLVAFAEENHQAVRGHTLVWNQQNPDWLNQAAWTRDSLIAELRDHIHTVVGHYRGRVAQWDVVNEAINERGGYRDNLWLRTIGPAYIALAFRFAHEADPNAVLFYNDSQTQYAGAAGDAVHRLVVGLQRQGVPIGGVGFESHRSIEAPTDQAELARRMAGYRALGLQVALTEVDVSMALPATPAKLHAQAAQYAATLRTCLAEPACHTFVLWGFTDRHSYIPTYRPGHGAALPFDARLRPKPAYLALMGALKAG